MSVSLTVLASALPEEGAALLRRVESPRSAPLAPAILSGSGRERGSGPCRRVALGRLGGTPVAVVVTGAGERAARAGAEWVLRRYPVSRLVSLGTASGLVAGLDPEDLLISERVGRVDDPPGRRGRTAPPGLVHLAVRATGGRPGTVVSPSGLLPTREEKRALGERWGRRGGRPVPAVADAEAAAFAEAARAAGLPWVSLHAVSDSVEEAWPGLLGECVDASGALQRGELLRGALRRPSAIPGLLRARRRLLSCSEILAEAAERLLEALEERGEAGIPRLAPRRVGRPPRTRRGLSGAGSGRSGPGP